MSIIERAIQAVNACMQTNTHTHIQRERERVQEFTSTACGLERPNNEKSYLTFLILSMVFAPSDSRNPGTDADVDFTKPVKSMHNTYMYMYIQTSTQHLSAL